MSLCQAQGGRGGGGAGEKDLQENVTFKSECAEPVGGAEALEMFQVG